MAECLEVGLDPLNDKRCPSDTFAHVERLREEGRDGAIVVVRIVDEVRVELDLAVVEVEVGRVREIAISIRIIAPTPPYHQTAKFTA